MNTIKRTNVPPPYGEDQKSTLGGIFERAAGRLRPRRIALPSPAVFAAALALAAIVALAYGMGGNVAETEAAQQYETGTPVVNESTTSPTTPTGAPKNLAATVGPTGVKIKWDQVDGATDHEFVLVPQGQPNEGRWREVSDDSECLNGPGSVESQSTTGPSDGDDSVVLITECAVTLQTDVPYYFADDQRSPIFNGDRKYTVGVRGVRGQMNIHKGEATTKTVTVSQTPAAESWIGWWPEKYQEAEVDINLTGKTHPTGWDGWRWFQMESEPDWFKNAPTNWRWETGKNLYSADAEVANQRWFVAPCGETFEFRNWVSNDDGESAFTKKSIRMPSC